MAAPLAPVFACLHCEGSVEPTQEKPMPLERGQSVFVTQLRCAAKTMWRHLIGAPATITFCNCEDDFDLQKKNDTKLSGVTAGGHDNRLVVVPWHQNLNLTRAQKKSTADATEAD